MCVCLCVCIEALFILSKQRTGCRELSKHGPARTHIFWSILRTQLAFHSSAANLHSIDPDAPIHHVCAKARALVARVCAKKTHHCNQLLSCTTLEHPTQRQVELHCTPLTLMLPSITSTNLESVSAMVSAATSSPPSGPSLDFVISSMSGARRRACN